MTRLILFTCLFNMAAFSAQAAEYHVCSNGSDSNDGLSHASAWRTYAKANSMFSTLNGGDSILFCKGEQFVISGNHQWDNRNSTRDNPITISSYTPPGGTDLGNPVIYAAGGQDGFTFMNGGNAEHREGYTVSNLVLRGDTVGGYGIYIYNDADFVTVTDVEIYDFRIGIHMGGANSPNPGSDGKNSDLKVQRAFIHDNYGQGWLGGGDNLLIENSVFVNNGFGFANLSHNVYISKSSINAIVRNNWIYQSTMVDGRCQGVSLVVHGIHTNLLIENNVLWEDPDAVGSSCWGITVDNGYGGQPEQFSGLTIRGNTVVNVGNVAIGCAVCQNAVIEDNIIVHQAPSHGSNVISVPNRNENSYQMLPQSNNVTVRNNTVFYDSPRPATGVRLGDGDGANYTSSGNDIYYAPGSGMTSGCESYNGGDSVTVSAGICQNSIPQNLLNDALARTELPVDLSVLENTGSTNGSGNSTSGSGNSSSVASSGSGSAGAIGWYYIGCMLMLLGIRSGRHLSKRVRP